MDVGPSSLMVTTLARPGVSARLHLAQREQTNKGIVGKKGVFFVEIQLKAARSI